MPTYECLIPTREQWRARRDKATGKPNSKGLCSKVSIGDSIDKFYKKYNKDHTGAIKEARELSNALHVYHDAVKKQYPKLAEAVKTIQEIKVDAYIELIGNLNEAQGQIQALLANLKTSLQQENVKALKKDLEKLKGQLNLVTMFDDNFKPYNKQVTILNGQLDAGNLDEDQELKNALSEFINDQNLKRLVT